MNSEKALKELCSKCEHESGKRKVACPFRSISNEYCDEYESIKNDLELLNQYEERLNYHVNTDLLYTSLFIEL